MQLSILSVVFLSLYRLLRLIPAPFKSLKTHPFLSIISVRDLFNLCMFFAQSYFVWYSSIFSHCSVNHFYVACFISFWMRLSISLYIACSFFFCSRRFFIKSRIFSVIIVCSCLQLLRYSFLLLLGLFQWLSIYSLQRLFHLLGTFALLLIPVLIPVLLIDVIEF